MPAVHTNLNALIERYDTLLLDAYGVLLDGRGPLAGATALIQHLNRSGHDYFILTNSASLLPEAMAAHFASIGLAIAPQQIISSGLLLHDYYQRHALHGAPTLVLGPEDAFAYVSRAGGKPFGPNQDGHEAGAVVIADQKGFDTLAGLNRALNAIIHQCDCGQVPHLILCNPDLIYPANGDEFGLTAGAFALMLEGVLEERYGADAPHFTRLGKPFTAMFDEARRRAQGKMVMLGDQLATDILGARRAGIDAVLVGSGVTGRPGAHSAIMPDFLLPSLTD